MDGSKQLNVTKEEFEAGIDEPVKAKLEPECEDITTAGVKDADNSAANLKKSGLLPVSSSLPVLVLSVWLQASPDNQMLRRL